MVLARLRPTPVVVLCSVPLDANLNGLDSALFYTFGCRATLVPNEVADSTVSCRPRDFRGDEPAPKEVSDTVKVSAGALRYGPLCESPFPRDPLLCRPPLWPGSSLIAVFDGDIIPAAF